MLSAIFILDNLISLREYDLFSQRNKNIEVIVLLPDDEKLGVKRKSRRKDYLKIFYYEKEWTIIERKNFGLSKAKGNYVSFLNLESLSKENIIRHAAQIVTNSDVICVHAVSNCLKINFIPLFYKKDYLRKNIIFLDKYNYIDLFSDILALYHSFDILILEDDISIDYTSNYNAVDTLEIFSKLISCLKKTIPPEECLYPFILERLKFIDSLILPTKRGEYYRALLEGFPYFQNSYQNNEYFSDWLYDIKKQYQREKVCFSFSLKKLGTEIIPIVIDIRDITDIYYADVLIKSIIAHSSEERLYDIYLCIKDKKLSNDVLYSNLKKNIRINFIYADLSKNILSVANLFTSYNRIIYMTPNHLCKNDIANIYELNMENYAIAGFPNAKENEYMLHSFHLYQKHICLDFLLLDINKVKELRLEDLLNLISADQLLKMEDKINVLSDEHVILADTTLNLHLPLDSPKRIDYANVCIVSFQRECIIDQNVLYLFTEWWDYARSSIFYEYLLKDFLTFIKQRTGKENLQKEYFIGKPHRLQTINNIQHNNDQNEISYMLDFIKESIFYIFTFGGKAKKHRKNIENLLKKLEYEND